MINIKVLRKVIVIVVIIIIVLSVFGFYYLNRFPTTDDIEYAEIYNIISKENIKISKEEARKLYNTYKIEKQTKDRVKAPYNNEIRFYNHSGKKVIQIDCLDPKHKEYLSAVVSTKVQHVIYDIDEEFYSYLIEIGKKYNFNYSTIPNSPKG